MIFSFDNNIYLKEIHKLCMKEINFAYNKKFNNIIIYENYFLNLKEYKLPSDINNYNLTIEKFNQKLIPGFYVFLHHERVDVTLYKVTLSKRIPNYLHKIKYLILKYMYYFFL